ncbi:MAG: AAA family ATPase, partial [Rhodospirillaceae bacterium]
MEMSTNFRIVRIGGGAQASEDYQRREGRYVNAGDDLYSTSRAMPAGCPEGWVSGGFWAAAEVFEKEHAERRWRRNTQQCESWLSENPGVELAGTIAEAPAGLSRSELARWIARETNGFKWGAGLALKKSPLDCRVRFEKGEEGAPGRLVYAAKSRAAWMIETGEIAQKGFYSVDNRLTQAQTRALVAGFEKRFVDRGLYVSSAIHWKDGNHHVHFIHSLREIDGGKFAKGRIVRVREELRDLANNTREWLAGEQNRLLAEAGFDPDVQFKSYADRGINLEATKHEGVLGVENTAEDSTRSQNQTVKQGRLDKALANPGSLIALVAETKAVFSESDIAALVAVDGEEDAADAAVRLALRSAGVVEIGRDLEGRSVYSTQKNLALEAKLEELIGALNGPQPGAAVDTEKLEQAIREIGGTKKQIEAARLLAGPERLAALLGMAGTGKTSRSLKIWARYEELMGRRVRAMAPYSSQAEALGRELGVDGADNCSAFALAWERTRSAQEMLKTGVLNEAGKASVRGNLDGLRKKVESGDRARWIPARIAEAEAMLAGGPLSEHHRRFLEAGIERDARFQLKAGDVVALDEAGVMSTELMVSVLDECARVGVRVRAVGDPEQFRPVGAGEPWRIVLERVRVAKLDEILRQRHDLLDCLMLRDSIDLESAAAVAAELDEAEKAVVLKTWMAKAKEAGPSWQAQATLKLETGDAAGGIRDYLYAGRVTWCDTKAAALAEVGNAVFAELERTPEAFGICPLNSDSRAVNADIKSRLQKDGRLDPRAPGVSFETENREGNATGETRFAAGDRVVFLRNARGGGLVPDEGEGPSQGVKNGTRGAVAGVTVAGHLRIRLDAEDGEPARIVLVDPGQYRALALGWCLTAHKSQGGTQRKTPAYLGGSTKQDGALVSCSRHTDELDIIVDKETFATAEDLLRAVDRSATKAMAMDFRVAEHEIEAERLAAAFVKADRKSAQLFKQIKAAGGDAWNHPQWPEYEAARAAVKPAALACAAQIDLAARFLKRDGSSPGLCLIAAGLKSRPMSREAERAAAMVGEYAALNAEARDTWNEIKKTARGQTVFDHPDYPRYDALRRFRDELAAQIAEKAPGYSRHCKAAGVTSAMIRKHAGAHADRLAAEASGQVKSTRPTPQASSTKSDADRSRAIDRSAIKNSPVEKSTEGKMSIEEIRAQLAIIYDRATTDDDIDAMVLPLYQAGAALDDAECLTALGGYYRDGSAGVPVDLQEALRLFTRAAALGDTDAEINLEFLHRDIEKEHDDAIKPQVIADLRRFKNPLRRFAIAANAYNRSSNAQAKREAKAIILLSAREILGDPARLDDARRRGEEPRVRAALQRIEDEERRIPPRRPTASAAAPVVSPRPTMPGPAAPAAARPALDLAAFAGLERASAGAADAERQRLAGAQHQRQEEEEEAAERQRLADAERQRQEEEEEAAERQRLADAE